MLFHVQEVVSEKVILRQISLDRLEGDGRGHAAQKIFPQHRNGSKQKLVATN